MGKIRVLSFAVANLIAAGEVVDRPASVVKELMENAIDAASRHVTVEIQNGGVTFMRVSDDGCGMSAEDLPVAIRRHATSKIRTAADLDGIATLGFRGEALAAIASVSDLRILSKVAGSPMGAVLEAHAGEVVSVTESGCMDGTTVIVEALFANVPARRKFLKKDATEAQAVTAAVERVALSHPEISFKLIVDGEIKLQTAGDGKLASAVYAVFGRDFAGRLLPLNGEYEGIGVSGYVGRSDNVKGNRNYQNFFINGRWIKSKTAMAALEQAYCSYLPPGRYPVCVLNLTLNPSRVDVNVHPAKLEVKFSNEKLIFEAVYYAVRQALQQNETRPDLSLAKSGASPTAGGRRVSDAFAPITDRAESVRKRQLSLTMSPGTEQGTSASSPAENGMPVASGKTGVTPVAAGSGVPLGGADADGKRAADDTFARMTAEDYIKSYMNSAARVRGDRNAARYPLKPGSYPKSTVPYGPNGWECPPARHPSETTAPTGDSSDGGRASEGSVTAGGPEAAVSAVPARVAGTVDDGGKESAQTPPSFTPVTPERTAAVMRELRESAEAADSWEHGGEEPKKPLPTPAEVPGTAVPSRDNRVTVTPAGEILLRDSLRAPIGADAPLRYDRSMPGEPSADGSYPLPPWPGGTGEKEEGGTPETAPEPTVPLLTRDTELPFVETDAGETPGGTGTAGKSYRIVGEVFYSYVLVEEGDRMLLIDKHAAHERLLFEDLKARLHQTEPSSQLLMVPLEVMLMREEVELLEEYRPELEAIGFLYTTARHTVEVTALPVGIEPGAAGDMLAAIADRIRNNTGSARLTRDILFEKALFQGACKAAIKAGRREADGHIGWLVDRLMALPDITFCPHGRPVALVMTKQNLDHQFERT